MPVLLPRALRPPAAPLAPSLGGLSRDPPSAPWAVERVPGALAVICRDGSSSSSPGSVYAPMIEPVCTAESFPVISPLAVSLCAVEGSPGLRQDAEDAAEVSLIPVHPGLFLWTLIPMPSRVSCRSRIPRKQVAIFSDILHNRSDSSCRQIRAGGFIGGGKNPRCSGLVSLLCSLAPAPHLSRFSNLI